MDKIKTPDTPWHVGYIKKDEDDPRRHMSRCIHIIDDKICMYKQSGCYLLKCPGSAHCKFYAEDNIQCEKEYSKQEQSRKIL